MIWCNNALGVWVKHLAIVALAGLILSFMGCSEKEGVSGAKDLGTAAPEVGSKDTASTTPNDVGDLPDQGLVDVPAQDAVSPVDTLTLELEAEDSQESDLGLADTGLPDTTVPEDVVPVEDVATMEPTVRFVAFGDSGKGNDGQKEVAKAVVAKCKKDGCDFIMLLGDNIYNSGVESVDDPQWQEKFEIPYADLDVLFRPALGNHDNGGLTLGVGGPPIDLLGEDGGTGMEFWRGDIQVDYSAVSPKWDMPARFYDYTMGSAHFFALDSNSMMFDQHGEQAEQMVAKITKSTATWKIAYGHHNYISNGKHGNAGNYDLPDWLNWVPGILGDLGEMISGTGVKAGIETIVCPTGIDLYIAGHDHNRQWFATGQEGCDGPEFVVSGAGASSTEFKNDQSNLFGDDTKLGFVWISIQGSKLHAEFIDTDGNVDFVRDLEK